MAHEIIFVKARAYADSCSLEEQAGANAVLAALKAPLCQITENAGWNSSYVLQNVLSHTKNEDYDFGFDATTGSFVHLMSYGIIDPAQVVCYALESAVSACACALTSEALITEIPDEIKEAMIRYQRAQAEANHHNSPMGKLY